MNTRSVARKRRGAVLIMFSLAILVIFGFIGLAFDVGRVILSRNEAQTFCDAAALAAVSMLDGTTTARAQNAVNGTYLNYNTEWKRYHLQTESFTGVTVKFSNVSADGPFVTLDPAAPAPDYYYVEVVAPTNIPMYLSPVLTGSFTGQARARAVAMQVKKTWWDEGLAPFAPKAHCTDSTPNNWGLPPCTSVDPATGKTVYDPHLVACPPPEQDGVVWSACPPASFYTIRYGANVWAQTFKDYPPDINDGAWCPGDQHTMSPNLSQALAEWYTSGVHFVDSTGFFSTDSISGANNYRQLIEGSMGGPVQLDTSIPGWDGQNPQEISAIAADLNAKAALGAPGSYVYLPIIDPVLGTIIQFGMYELYQGGTTNNYSNNGNANWCAVYRGVCLYGTCGGQVFHDGIYEIRLVR